MRKLNAPWYKYFFVFLYYSFAIHLPKNTNRVFGKISRKIRYDICKHIFEFCGEDVSIEKGARFINGFKLRIGNHSGLGVNCFIPDGSKIGDDVMMGPNCYCLAKNHSFNKVDIPMRLQGYLPSQVVVIEDDVWIGRDVLILPGRHIAKGSIIGAGCVLTKDFPEYSIVGGNPSRLIRSRIENKE